MGAVSGVAVWEACETKPETEPESPGRGSGSGIGWRGRLLLEEPQLWGEGCMSCPELHIFPPFWVGVDFPGARQCSLARALGHGLHWALLGVELRQAARRGVGLNGRLMSLQCKGLDLIRLSTLGLSHNTALHVLISRCAYMMLFHSTVNISH